MKNRVERGWRGTASCDGKKDADVREAIYHTCVEHHMPILEMKAASKSLEDVFLELTSQEGGTK